MPSDSPISLGQAPWLGLMIYDICDTKCVMSRMTLPAPPPNRGAAATSGAAHRIAFYLAPQFSMMAFVSAVEPLRVANRLGGRALYEWGIVSARGAPGSASNGMTLLADGTLSTLSRVATLGGCAGFDPRRGYCHGLRPQLHRPPP